MEKAVRHAQVVRFATFEVDLQAGEVRKAGLKLKFGGQPFQVLAILLEQPGAIVTREELQKRLWPDTFVDVDHNLNTAINKIREALGDSAESPRFVETLPRRGYRFIYPLNAGTAVAAIPRWVRRQAAWIITTGVALLAIAATVSFYVLHLRTSPSVPRIASLAVLPCTNLSGDQEQDYFADGMTDQLVASLSKIHSLNVISRTSVMGYKGTNKTVPQIARELNNVDGVIECTVLRSGDRVRTTVQLIHAPSDTHLWAETYERDLPDIMTLQDEVAGAVARQIRIALTPAEEKQLARNRPVDPKAYEFYLKGRFHLSNRMVEKAAASFSEAIKLAPEYAEAYAGLAASYILYEMYEMPNPELTPKEVIFRGKAAALRALQIDDSVAEAHASLAWARMVYDWDWAGAEAEFKVALALNPNYETGHLWYGCELVWEKRFDEGLAEMKRAQEIAPASPLMNASLGMGLYQARQYKKAIDQLKNTMELDATFPRSHVWLGLTYLASGMQEEAVSELEKGVHFAKERQPGNSAHMSRLGYAYGTTGRRKQAKALLEELRRMSATKYVPATSFAVVYVGLGEKDLAFTWLNKAYEERTFELALINADPRFDSLRSDPRFQDLIRRLNFPS